MTTLRVLAQIEGEHLAEHVDQAIIAIEGGDWAAAVIHARHAYNQAGSWLNSLESVAKIVGQHAGDGP